ncbi:MAG: indole-3-glycerol phosphate synthase TrpC [Bacteroidota bacterium]|nr:indole-3-glycerol phosphate synthase TrpC [Bacteroidota bacterium]
MNILETIIAKKKIEVVERKLKHSVADLEKGPFFKNETLSFKEFLLRKDKTGIIAEFKRQSPSKGIINNTSSVSEVTSDYVTYGASAISILTDEAFFGGSLNDLSEATINDLPILRKEFIIDEYQLVESKAFGADVILLIAACLSREEVKNLSSFAHNIGLNVLLEIHNEQELDHICDDVDVIGINNRDLKSFKVDLNHSIELCKKIPADKIKISESGINEVSTIHFLKQNGFSGFLMGEKFMREQNPGNAFRDFVKELKETSKI